MIILFCGLFLATDLGGSADPSCVSATSVVRYEHYFKTRVKHSVAKQHVIELNGKRYDALTGHAIANAPVMAQRAVKSASRHLKRISVDGFARARNVKLHQPNPTPMHKTQKSKTLMRKAVAKPSGAIQAVTSPAEASAVILSAAPSVSASKLAHAQAVPKSKLIRRFSDMTSMRHMPAAATERAEPVSRHRLQAVAKATAVPASPLSVGLAGAHSHEQPKVKRARRHVRLAKRLRVSPRVVSGGSLALAGLLIAGFFTYQNIPNLNMRLASARAGVHGSLPSYQPAGFGLKGGISYSPGQITVSYKSHSDDRGFKITQSSSSWNSETLRENYEALKNSAVAPLEIPDKGKTVYIYNGSNATWVDSGVWYRVEGDSKLNSTQLLSLANSL